MKHADSDQEQMELERKLRWMKETEMCVVISQEQNEIQTFKKWNLDILPHRAKMEKRELDKEFKDPDRLFDRLVTYRKAIYEHVYTHYRQAA